MSTVTFTLPWNWNAPPDESVACDMVVLVVVIGAVVYLLTGVVLAVARRHTPSMQTKRPWTVVLMVVGSVMHIVAEFVSNAHLASWDTAESVRNVHCTLWDFWFKYALGFNLWYVAQAARMFSWDAVLRWDLEMVRDDGHAADMREKMGSSIPVRRCPAVSRSSLATATFSLAIALPLVVLSLVVEFAHGSAYDALVRWCETRTVYKVTLISCLVLCVVVLSALVLRVRRYRRSALMSYVPTRNSVLVGVVFLVALVLANLLSISVAWWGRALSTLLVVALYVSSYTFLMHATMHSAAVHGLTRAAPGESQQFKEDLGAVAIGENGVPDMETVMSFKEMDAAFIGYISRQSERLLAPSALDETVDVDQLIVASIEVWVAPPVTGTYMCAPAGQYVMDDDDVADTAMWSSVGIDPNVVSTEMTSNVSARPRHVIEPSKVISVYEGIKIYRRYLGNGDTKNATSVLRNTLVNHFPIASPGFEQACRRATARRAEQHTARAAAIMLAEDDIGKAANDADPRVDMHGEEAPPTIAQFLECNYDACIVAMHGAPVLPPELMASHALPLTRGYLYKLYRAAARYHEQDVMRELSCMIDGLLRYRWFPAFISQDTILQRYRTLRSEMLNKLAHRAGVTSAAPQPILFTSV